MEQEKLTSSEATNVGAPAQHGGSERDSMSVCHTGPLQNLLLSSLLSKFCSFKPVDSLLEMNVNPSQLSSTKSQILEDTRFGGSDAKLGKEEKVLPQWTWES